MSLTVSTDISPERLAAAAQRLPSSPRVFLKLQSALRDLNTSVDALVALVRVDSALSASVVRVSNSPVFRRGLPITTLDEAINRIGLREIHRLVGLAMAGQLCAAELPLYHLAAESLWENSLAVALAAEHLARLAGDDERLAYTLGLLRSVGRSVLQRFAVEDTIAPAPAGSLQNPAQLFAWETAHFGITSSEVTARLLARWGFPESACDPVRWHHRAPTSPVAGRTGALLHLACWVAETLGKGLPDEASAWSNDPELEKRAGVPPGSSGEALLPVRGELNQLQAMIRSRA